jgi:chitodextrinase
MIVGDSPQSLIVNLSEAQAATYFADRKAMGFNAVWINLLCNAYTGGNTNGTTFDGIAPFTTPGRLSKPNPAYFQRVDDMVNLAAQYGLTVFLDPIETGGWLSTLQKNGAKADYNYGVYIGSRYKNFANIVWMHGNDFQSWSNASDDALVQAVANGVRSADPNHIHTIELSYNVSSSLDDTRWAPIVSLNAAYTYYPTYAEVLHAYNQSSAVPAFLVEAYYEFENNTGMDYGSPATLRRQEYWTQLSGATGQLYGNHYTWTFSSGWQNNLDTEGAIELGYLKGLFGSKAWYNLVPDQNHAVVTAGYGTFATSGSLGSNDYATAARTPDGSLVMAYLPTVRTITVDMTMLSGPVTAQWFDPTNNTYMSASSSALPNQGSWQFTPPGNNDAGAGDWVLVLQAPTASVLDTTPPSVPTNLQASNITPNSLTIRWTASTDNVAVAGYQIFRNGTQIAVSPVPSYNDSGLTASTSYTYTVAAFDTSNNVSAQSQPLTVSTEAASTNLAFVQANAATPQTPQSTVTAIYTWAQSASDTDIVVIGWNDTTANIISVGDSAGNAYEVAVPTARGRKLSQAIYYAKNIKAAATGTNAVTVTFDNAAAYADIRILEYSGLDLVSPFDVGASASGSAGTANSGSAITARPEELIIGAGMTAGSYSGPGAGFMARIITTPDSDIAEDKTTVSAGSYNATAPADNVWLMQMAAFKAAGQ